jgi:hypothetical protein
MSCPMRATTDPPSVVWTALVASVSRAVCPEGARRLDDLRERARRGRRRDALGDRQAVAAGGEGAGVTQLGISHG